MNVYRVKYTIPTEDEEWITAETQEEALDQWERLNQACYGDWVWNSIELEIEDVK
tara:strand:- start:429 stop:593 length:165 start_codon:yes stop_codon:yes gene_type:complete